MTKFKKSAMIQFLLDSVCSAYSEYLKLSDALPDSHPTVSFALGRFDSLDTLCHEFDIQWFPYYHALYEGVL